MKKANRALTPGAVDPAATKEIVLAKGYAASRRPTLWQALKLKGQAMKRYGVPLTPRGWHGCVLDHLVPLELGGQPLDLANVWPQPKGESHIKDRDEYALRRRLSLGAISLADAQAFFIVKWSV